MHNANILTRIYFEFFSIDIRIIKNISWNHTSICAIIQEWSLFENQVYGHMYKDTIGIYLFTVLDELITYFHIYILLRTNFGRDEFT